MPRSRFIPTHVGNSQSCVVVAPTITVHPHACGELAVQERKFKNSSGSSPRMWGTPSYSYLAEFNLRFIPTHVGNSSDVIEYYENRAVHPHACGELQEPADDHIHMLGSSPRMWGTLNLYPEEEAQFRFIPTHVGNSNHIKFNLGVLSVHPHACGELLILISSFSRGDGSSPRMWGTLFNFYTKTRKVTSGDLRNF